MRGRGSRGGWAGGWDQSGDTSDSQTGVVIGAILVFFHFPPPQFSAQLGKRLYCKKYTTPQSAE